MSPRPSPSAFAWSVQTMYWHCLASTLAFSPSERKVLKILHQASPTYHVSTFRLPDRYMRSSHCVYTPEAIKDREEAGEGLDILLITSKETQPFLHSLETLDIVCERVSSTSQMKMVHKDVGAVKEVGNTINEVISWVHANWTRTSFSLPPSLFKLYSYSETVY